MRTSPRLPPHHKAVLPDCKTPTHLCFLSCILGFRCFTGGKWCICTKRRLGSAPSLAEQQLCWDGPAHRPVWNVECKQSMLPATARLGAATQTCRCLWGGAKPTLLPAPIAAQGTLVTLDQIVTVNKLCPFCPPFTPALAFSATETPASAWLAHTWLSEAMSTRLGCAPRAEEHWHQEGSTWCPSESPGQQETTPPAGYLNVVRT